MTHNHYMTVNFIFSAIILLNAFAFYPFASSCMSLFHQVTFFTFPLPYWLLFSGNPNSCCTVESNIHVLCPISVLDSFCGNSHSLCPWKWRIMVCSISWISHMWYILLWFSVFLHNYINHAFEYIFIPLPHW